MDIRTATEDDAADLQRFAERLFLERPPGVFARPVPTVEDEISFIRSRIEPENSTLLLATDASGVIGVLDFAGGALQELKHSGAFGVSVDRDHRGRGIGTALIEALLEWAPSAGITRVEVRAWSNNPGALRLYRRMGFVQEGVLSGALMVDGTPVDEVILASRGL